MRGLTQQETELEKKTTMVVAVVTTSRYRALTPCKDTTPSTFYAQFHSASCPMLRNWQLYLHFVIKGIKCREGKPSVQGHGARSGSTGTHTQTCLAL